MAVSAAGCIVVLAVLAVGCATTSPDDAGQAPRERKDYLFEAVRLSEARKYDEAIELLKQLQAEEEPEDAATTHYLLGSAYAGLSDHANAAAQYVAAVAKAEDVAAEMLATARLGAGHYSFLAGRYDDAVRHLSAWRNMTAAPRPETLMELALAYSRTGANADAIAVAEGVIGASDEATIQAEWFEMLAGFYYENGQYTDALKAEDRAESRRVAAVMEPAPARVPSARTREPRERALPDTQTLRTLQAQTRALLSR